MTACFSVVGGLVGAVLVVVAVVAVVLSRRRAKSTLIGGGRHDLESSVASTTEWYSNPSYKGKRCAGNTTDFLKDSAELDAGSMTGEVSFNGREFAEYAEPKYYLED